MSDMQNGVRQWSMGICCARNARNIMLGNVRSERGPRRYRLQCRAAMTRAASEAPVLLVAPTVKDE
ncbi:MAG: hypothetical protein P8Y25_04250 [Chromatiaceae bacterium]